MVKTTVEEQQTKFCEYCGMDVEKCDGCGNTLEDGQELWCENEKHYCSQECDDS